MKLNVIKASRGTRRTTTRARAVSRAAVSRAAAAPLELTWPHFGVLHRLTLWPEAALERLNGDRWEPVAESEAVLDDGAVHLNAAAWRRYLEFMPARERALVERFRFGRLGALLCLARCPALLADLEETPALVAFLAAHAELRGSPGLRWDEVAAVHERGGVFGLLEWLGLPSSRQTLGVLRNLIDAEVPRRLLEPLRTLLWRPSASLVLQRSPGLTDEQLARYCHALAA